MIIDAHIHLWNRLHGDDLGIDREALSWGRARQGDRIYYAAPPAFDDSLSNYERAIAHMNCLGIDRVVVLQEFMDGKQDDYLAEVRRFAPEKFSCMALFDRHYYDDPMSAFKVAIDEKKLHGFLVKTPDPFPERSRRRRTVSSAQYRSVIDSFSESLPATSSKMSSARSGSTRRII